MNKVYRLIWSTAHNAWVAVCEFARAKGRQSSGKRAVHTGTSGVAVALALLAIPAGVVIAREIGEATGTDTKAVAAATVEDNKGVESAGSVAALATPNPGPDLHYYSINSSATGAGSNYANDGAAGENSMAAGAGASASGIQSTAIGNGAQATGDYTTTVGMGAQATVIYSTAVGQGASATNIGSTALGYMAQAPGRSGTALGMSATAGGDYGTAVGQNARANGYNGSALGFTSEANGDLSTAVGSFAKAYGENSTSVGYFSVVNGVTAGALGFENLVNSRNSYAIGNFSQLTDANQSDVFALGNQISQTIGNSVALGSKSAMNADLTAQSAGMTIYNSQTINGTTTNVAGGEPVGVVSVGGVGSERRIQNVAAGLVSADSTDAVNGSQLNAVATDALMWDPSVGAYSANHGGNGPNKIVNVAAGDISASSTDAINGSQLNATNQQVDQNTTNITNISNNIDNGTLGPVQRTGTDQLSLIAAGGDATAPGAAQVLTNVADGAITPTSTDAINGSQLHETNQNITNVDNRVSNVFGDDSVANVQQNGRGIRYVRTNDNGLPVEDAYAQGQGSTAVGYQATATGDSALALGRNANASADNSVALGTNSTTTSDLAQPAYAPNGAVVAGVANGEVSVGSAGAERRVTNVAAGAADTDAVNVSQLKGLAGRTDQLTQDALQWDPTANGGLGAYSANHGGSGPNKITHVAAGDISASSTDAVNGAQLFDVTNQINNIALGAAKYFHASSTKADSVASGTDSVAVGPAAQASGTSSIAMGDGANASGTNASAIGSNASASGSGATATGNGASASGASSVAMGDGASASGERSAAIGAGADAQADNSVALGAGSLADRDNSVSVGSVGNERQITNVKAGEADTDAVNVAQLRAQGDTISNVDNRVNQAATDITHLQNGTDGMFQVNNSSNLPKPRARGVDSVAGGAGAEASGNNSAAIGTRSRASGSNATALGNGSNAQGSNSVALGANSVADRANSVSVGSAGNERQITNVAAGTAPTDAVNVSQLQKSIGDISSQYYDYADSHYNALRHDLKKQDDMLSAGIAGAMAMASLPQPYSPGASMATVGVGNYRGQGALAVGVSKISDNGKWITKLEGTTSSQGDTGLAVGVGYQW